jgi:hypothetical protein
VTQHPIDHEILQLPCDVWIAVAAGAAVGLGAALWAMVVPKKKGRRRRLAAEASISNGNTLHTSIIERWQRCCWISLLVTEITSSPVL